MSSTLPWLETFIESAPLSALARGLAPDVNRSAPAAWIADGSRGSSTNLVTGALAIRTGRSVLLVTAHLDEADDALDDLELLAQAGHPLSVQRFGALEVMPGESSVNLELLAERLGVVGGIRARPALGERHGGTKARSDEGPEAQTESDGATERRSDEASSDYLAPQPDNPSAPSVIVAPIAALMQAVPSPEEVGRFAKTLEPETELGPNALAQWLDAAGYVRRDAIEEPGDFAVRGGIVDVYPPAGEQLDQHGTPTPGGPVRLDYFGDEIERLFAVDPSSLASTTPLSKVSLIGASAEQLQQEANGGAQQNLLELLPADWLAILHEPLELAEQGRGYYERLTNPVGIYPPDTVSAKLMERDHVEVNQYSASGGGGLKTVPMPVRQLPSFDQDAKQAVRELGELAADSENEVVVLCRKRAEADRLKELLNELSPDHAEKVRIDLAPLHHGFSWSFAGKGRRGSGAKGQRGKGSKAVQGPTSNVKSQDTQGSATLDLGPSTLDASPSQTPDDAASRDVSGAHEEARPSPQVYLIPHHELFHRYELTRRVRKVTTEATSQASDAFLDLEVGDYVVHVDHGIARFVGLKRMRPTKKRGGQKADMEGQSVQEEFLTLEFANKANLHVPATQIDQVQKYVGGFHGKPPLSKLGGQKWQRQKDEAADAARQMAAELLRVQAARQTQPGVRYPADTPWQQEFEAEFPYDETDDQLAAAAAAKNDMTLDRPMDRLLCGDVGFGKTEVAIRAAFKAAEYGKQVAVLVPTTVLSEQHERTFKQRLADYPFRIESLSRFKSGKKVNQTLKAVNDGAVDILIGTHRILSNDVHFSDLGMVIIDEEQRFGVEHKHKLLELRMTADVLTMTATPIPRTLHMSMVGLRDISSLSTPPVDRRAIVTEVVPYEAPRIQQAIRRELSRDGQVFFVHNRVHNIFAVRDEIQNLVPEARIVVGHGQMSARQLEAVMLQFVRGNADVLVCTTIIESGIDIPTANTLLVNRADQFGLADLHQLRGRVGRYKHRAYCYLLLPPEQTVSDKAAKRLRAIEQYAMLGAGFKIAMRDLEIRGAGNLLGAEQSGHIAAVGYEMYCSLLDQETRKLQNQAVIEPSRTHLELPITGALSKRFIESDKFRLETYRRLSRAQTLDQLHEVTQALTDAYGPPPAQAQTLFELTALRIAAATAQITQIKQDGPDLIFISQTATELSHLFENVPGRVTQLNPTTTYYRPPTHSPIDHPPTLLAILRHLLLAPTNP